MKDGLLLKDTRLVIPIAMRKDVLAQLHEGHQGVEKCKSCARQSVWWPGLNQQINKMVLNYRAYIQERQNRKETLMPSECPERPWQMFGADLFLLGSKTYLLVVDYFSRYVEIA